MVLLLNNMKKLILTFSSFLFLALTANADITVTTGEPVIVVEPGNVTTTNRAPLEIFFYSRAKSQVRIGIGLVTTNYTSTEFGQASADLNIPLSTLEEMISKFYNKMEENRRLANHTPTP